LRDYEFQIELITATERKLKLLMDDDKLSGFDSYKLTSFLRGDIFIDGSNFELE